MKHLGRPSLARRAATPWMWLCALALSPFDLGGAVQVPHSTDTLRGEALSRSPAIGWPGFMQPWGKHLLITDWQGDPNLHLLDRATGELIVSFGRIGQGPGDFPGLLSGAQQPRHDSSAVWVYDGRKLTRIDRPGPIGADVAAIDLTVVPLVSRAAWLDSMTIVGVTLRPPERRFVFFDPTTGNVTKMVPGVLLGNDRVPVSQRVEAGKQVSFCVHPQGTSFAVLYMDAASIQIYDRTARHLVDAAVPHPIDAPFSRVDGEWRFVPETMTYNACWGSDDVLYALYSGDNFETATLDTLGGQEIHLFDWTSGQLLRLFHLDVRILAFAVDEDAGWLYGGSMTDAAVYRFRLPGGGQ